jgi:hypothetical protein
MTTTERALELVRCLAVAECEATKRSFAVTECGSRVTRAERHAIKALLEELCPEHKWREQDIEWCLP